MNETPTERDAALAKASLTEQEPIDVFAARGEHPVLTAPITQEEQAAARAHLDHLFAGPTPEEMQELEDALVEQARVNYPRVRPFFIENWPPAFRAMSVQTEIYQLREPQFLADYIKAGMNGETVDEGIALMSILRELAAGLELVGGLGFVRLGSRSPKDNPCIMRSDNRPGPVFTARGALEALGYSERVFHDLSDAIRAGYTPRLCVRRWLDIEPEQEFRVFVENQGCVGITQYYLDAGYSSWINANSLQIERAVWDYVMNAMLPHAERHGMHSFTADVIVGRDMRVTLLEINPPVSWGLTYPGLFGDGNEFDGSFRYLTEATAMGRK